MKLKITPGEHDEYRDLENENDEIVAGWVWPSDAAHIVHCVNVYEQLVEALTDVDEWLCDDRYDLPEEVQEKVRAALAAAKEWK